ncbi:MAG TPA: hypothetical protein VF363_06135 [Candidatus Eisenbacteria bacterium]
MTRLRSSVLFALATLVAVAILAPAPARADRKYFVETYTPYLAPAGELEFETWLTARSGRQDPSERVAWEQREEFEYAVTDRLTTAAYLNFSQPSGGSLRFTAPSLELIYRMADPGRIPGDPAVYLETTESGEELEMEPKLLLARRAGRLVSAANVIGEFEFRHNDDELLESGAVLRKAWAWALTGGAAYEVSPNVSVALEARYRSEYPNFGPRSGAAFSLGPAVNLQAGKVQLAIGMLKQVRGTPRTTGNLNLADFERTEIRTIIGVDL